MSSDSTAKMLGKLDGIVDSGTPQPRGQDESGDVLEDAYLFEQRIKPEQGIKKGDLEHVLKCALGSSKKLTPMDN